jgi:hypothetical protein
MSCHVYTGASPIHSSIYTIILITEPRGNACCEAARVRAGWSLCCSRQPPSPGKEA